MSARCSRVEECQAAEIDVFGHVPRDALEVVFGEAVSDQDFAAHGRDQAIASLVQAAGGGGAVDGVDAAEPIHAAAVDERAPQQVAVCLRQVSDGGVQGHREAVPVARGEHVLRQIGVIGGGGRTQLGRRLPPGAVGPAQLDRDARHGDREPPGQ